jgi:hypothetical protein
MPWACPRKATARYNLFSFSDHAYPTVPENVSDTLAKQHFIEALADSEMRIRIKQSRHQNLNDAFRLAVELQTFNRAERRVTEGRSYLRTTTADSAAGKVSDKTKVQYYPVYYSDLLSLRS